MKTNWCLLTVAVLSWLMPQEAGASGACTAARIHDQNNLGCNQLFCGAGGQASGKLNAGGNQSTCTTGCGMPRWWVSEPYISLEMVDTPLSYTTSSGQEMAFRFYYSQRPKTPDNDEVTYSAQLNVRDQISTAYGPTGAGSFASNCGTNACWGNNWTMSVVIWDATWDGNWVESQYNPGVYFGHPSYAPYSQGYQALVWRPEGGMNYFNITQSSLATGSPTIDPTSQVKLLSVATNGYPLVETATRTGMSGYINNINLTGATPVGTLAIINLPQHDTNGIYWGDPGVGVKLVYPDGSQDVFGLSAVIMGVIGDGNASPPAGSGADLTGVASTSRLLLTQRIDPQGRTTSIGYEQTGPLGYTFYRVRYVVDPDGRTNSFFYNSTNTSTGGFLVKEIDDPYGRKTTLTSSNLAGGAMVLGRIVDAAGLTNSFGYQADNSGWITSLNTPYGTTYFNYYQVTDSTVTDGFQKRAICISEPTGAGQLYLYQHTNTPYVPASMTSPSNIPGQSFDDGTSGTAHYALSYRDSFYWGRRQFAALTANNYYFSQAMGYSFTYQSSSYSYSQAEFASALAYLQPADYNKARLKHWLLGADAVSLTDSLSSERDPSSDALGNVPGLWTWYNYAGKTSPETLGSSTEPSCIARILPDGTSQYTTYNYYPFNSTFPNLTPAGNLVSDNESSYTKPDGSAGVLTNAFAYATNGIDLLSISNSAGQYVNYGYNGSHQIIGITNSLNQVTTLSWDTSTFNLTGVQLPSGKSYSLSYYSPATPPTTNSSLMQTMSISPEGRTYTINSYSAGLPTSITDDRGLTVANSWDGLNRLTGTLFPDGTSVSNMYSRLDIVGSKDRQSNWTYFAFDGLQHLITVTNANNAVTTYSWCGCGSLDQITDALTNNTYLNYDNQGNLTNIVFPDFSSLTYQFDLAGRMTNAFDGSGRALQLAYNNQDLPVSITGAGGVLQQRIYDALNRPISITDANGVTVTNQFDPLGELVQRTWPDGISEGFKYSAAGLIAYTNRDQKVTQYGRDTAGRLTAVTNANLEVTQFGYDSLDNVISLMDGLLHQTTWQYNQYGWLTNKVDGLSRNAFQLAYNSNGWLTNRWTPEKGNTGYTYDNVGNLKSIVYPQQTISYAYDALNRLTNMIDGVGSTAFGYTPAGQLQSESGPWANDSLTYTYAQGLRTALTLAQTTGNWLQTYGFDTTWRMTNTVSPAGAFVYSYNFQPGSSLITGIHFPNWANVTNGFDSLGRLRQTVLNNYWGHPLDSYTYTPDALGLRTNIVRNLGLASSTVNAGFDNIGQLTSWSAKESGGTLRQNEQLGFGFDAADNLHSRNNGGLSQTFTTDAANELTGVSRTSTFTLGGATPAPATNVTVNGQAAQTYADFTFAGTNLSLANGANTFAIVAQNAYGVTATNNLTLNLPSSVGLNFDNNGNLTNDGTRSFAFDAENQLTNVTVAGQWRSDFVYDGFNRRRIARDFTWQSSAWVLTNEVHYIYDGRLLIQERDTNGNALVTYTRGVDLSGSVRGAGGIGGLLARTDTNGTTFYHADGVGNITALMDAGQNIVARYLYDPFGRLIGQWGSMANANAMQFSSKPKYRGLYDFSLRWYVPELNRFLNQDPIGENGGINLYRFALNNPLQFIDPYGLQIAPSMYDLFNQTQSISYTPLDFNNLAPIVLTQQNNSTGPALSPADPNAEPYLLPQLAVVDGLLLGSDLNPSSSFAQDFARDVQAPLISSFLPLPVLKGPIDCPIATASAFATKNAARNAISQMLLSDAQFQAALRAIARATSKSAINITKEGENLIVKITRPGRNGYQEIVSTIDESGTKTVVQKAYDQSGKLVHYDPKTQ